MNSERVSVEPLGFFQDDGWKLYGELYRSSDEDPDFGVVFCNGFGATVDQVAPTIAAALVRESRCAVLAFDYSGFGQSEGPSNRIDPWRQVRDARAAVSALSAWTNGALRGRVVVYGTSFGAPVATATAALDQRVRALVSVNGFASGRVWLRQLRPRWQWIESCERARDDEIDRAITGHSEIVDPDWVMPRDPAAARFNEELKSKSQARRDFRLDIATYQAIMEFEPADVANRLRTRPALFIHSERDLMMDATGARELGQLADAEVLILPGIGHYEVYERPVLDEVTARAVATFVGALSDE